MQKTFDTNNNISSDAEAVNTRKTWNTPELRILPVPSKTQGGKGKKNDQDDQFYKKS